jgi:hypothetical protein
MGAELCLRINDHESAKSLYAAVTESKALPWAKLGLARAELESLVAERHWSCPQASRTSTPRLAARASMRRRGSAMGTR